MSPSPLAQARLILHEPGDGRRNMAIDHALLEGVARPGAEPVIRLYGFSPPTLSLGRFQRAADILDAQAARRDGVVVVRRPSGGQAVLHDGELTYCAVLARRHLERFSKREVYRLVAGLLLGALERLGLSLASAGSRAGDPYNPDCFRTTGEYEITDRAGRKLVGSAQLVTRAGALQHGAVVIDDSNRRISRYLRASGAPASHESASLSGLLGRPVSFAWLREEVARGLGEALATRRDEMDSFERDAADRLHREVYGRDAWNLVP